MRHNHAIAKRKTIAWRATLAAILILMSLSVTVTALYFFVPLGRQAVVPVSSLAAKEPLKPARQPISGLPSRIEIADINVNAVVTPVGIASDGTMAILEDPTITAWYKYGPHPGDVGSAVIAGHYGWKAGKASVFNDLHTMKAGDKVQVYDTDSAKIVFVVRELRLYDPKADAREVFQSSDNKAHLNLITCEGEWNNGQQTYSSRLVVFTDRAT